MTIIVSSGRPCLCGCRPVRNFSRSSLLLRLNGFQFSGIRHFLFLRLLLEFVVGHGDNGQDQVDKVVRAKENDDNEEEHVPRARTPQNLLVQAFPEILRHQPEA